MEVRLQSKPRVDIPHVCHVVCCSAIVCMWRCTVRTFCVCRFDLFEDHRRSESLLPSFSFCLFPLRIKRRRVYSSLECKHGCVLFENQRRLRAVLPLQVQPVGEVVLSSQEGVEIIWHQQDLKGTYIYIRTLRLHYRGDSSYRLPLVNKIFFTATLKEDVILKQKKNPKSKNGWNFI